MSRRGTAHPTPVKDVGLARTSRKWSPESSALPCGNWCDSSTRRRIQRNKEPARHSTYFRNTELLPDRPDKPRKLRRFAGARRFRPPNGFRPQRIGLAAGDDVDVQLRHHVAQRGDIDLVALRHFFERQRGERERRRGVSVCLAISTPAVLPSVGRKTSAPRTCLTPLNTSPAPSPVNASRLPSRTTRASLGASAVRYSFHRDGLPPSTSCRSPGAPVHSITSRHRVLASISSRRLLRGHIPR